MNEFIMFNWYQYDLNYDIIKELRNKYKKTCIYSKDKKIIIKERIEMDNQLKIKYD